MNFFKSIFHLFFPSKEPVYFKDISLKIVYQVVRDEINDSSFCAGIALSECFDIPLKDTLEILEHCGRIKHHGTDLIMFERSMDVINIRYPKKRISYKFHIDFKEKEINKIIEDKFLKGEFLVIGKLKSGIHHVFYVKDGIIFDDHYDDYAITCYYEITRGKT